MLQYFTSSLFIGFGGCRELTGWTYADIRDIYKIAGKISADDMIGKFLKRNLVSERNRPACLIGPKRLTHRSTEAAYEIIYCSAIDRLLDGK